ncbi:MAG: hypothetical protein AAF599_08565 [Bacteroidota bacterium]
MLTKLDEVTQKLKECLKEQEAELIKKVEGGDFINFEKELKNLTDDFSKDLMQSMLNEGLTSTKMEEKATSQAESKRLTIRKTTVEILIWNGKKIRIPAEGQRYEEAKMDSLGL